MLWTEWWVWGAFAIILVILEIIAPAYVFLGFGIGAAVVSLVLGIGGPLADILTQSWGWMLSGFAVVSVVAWVVLRAALGVTRNQVRTFDEDINDN